MWVKSVATAMEVKSTWITPARAGKIHKSALTLTTFQGSPPLVRVKSEINNLEYKLSRDHPARAGKMIRSIILSTNDQNHPARAGKIKRGEIIQQKPGITPPVRVK